MLKKIFNKLISWEKWEMVYSTQDFQRYASAKGKLINNNIPVKTKIINHGSARFGRSSRDPSYTIYVKPEDIHRANEAIHYG